MHYELIGQTWVAGDLTSSPAVGNAAQFSTLHQSGGRADFVGCAVRTAAAADSCCPRRTSALV